MAFVIMTMVGNAQNNVGINPTGALPDPSAALDVVSNNKGMLIPRMSAAQRLAIVNPANGLMVFDTDTMCVLFYRTATLQWYSLCNSSMGPVGPAGPTGAAGSQGTTRPGRSKWHKWHKWN